MHVQIWGHNFNSSSLHDHNMEMRLILETGITLWCVSCSNEKVVVVVEVQVLSFCAPFTAATKSVINMRFNSDS